MSSRTNIDPLSITDGKISNQAKISPKKIAPADEASLLIAQGDRKYQPKTIYGDGTIDADGKLTITSTPAPTTTIVEEELLPEDSVRIGPSSTDNTKKNSTKKVGSGAGAIPTRDSSGNLKAETADNADKLDNQDGGYYTDVSNHTAGSSANTLTPSGLGSGQTGVVGTTQTVPMQMITATNTGASSGTTDYIVEHNFNSIPVAVQVLEDDGSGNLEEVETEVVSTTSQTAIKFSVADKSFTAKIIGVKS